MPVHVLGEPRRTDRRGREQRMVHRRDAGVVDQRVEAAVAGAHAGEEFPDARLVDDVELGVLVALVLELRRAAAAADDDPAAPEIPLGVP